MIILHSGSLDIKSGGPALSTYLTIKGLKTCGVVADMLMSPLANDGKLITKDVPIHYTRPVMNKRFGYMPQLTVFKFMSSSMEKAQNFSIGLVWPIFCPKRS